MACLGQTNLSTSADWDFLTNSAQLAPDGNNVVLNAGNSGQGPLLNVSPNMTWSNALDPDGEWTTNQNAVTPGAMSIPYPNWLDQEPIKYLHFQTLWSSLAGLAGAPNFTIDSIDSANGPILSLIPPVQTFDYLQANGQYNHVEDWQIIPNPNWENIVLHVPQGTSIDEVVIDTISIPEPAAGLLFLAALPLFIRRRRR